MRVMAIVMSSAVISTLTCPEAWHRPSNDCFAKVKMRSQMPPFMRARASGSVPSSIILLKTSKLFEVSSADRPKPFPWAIFPRIFARSNGV